MQFAWFDPQSGTYHTAQTDEFSFTVLQGEDDNEAAGVYIPGVLGESVRDLGTDIRDISRASPVFTMVDRSLFGSSWYRLFYPVALVLTLVLILLISMLAKRNANLTLVRTRRIRQIL